MKTGEMNTSPEEVLILDGYNISFEDFRSMATECRDHTPNEQPIVYVTA